MDGEDLLQMTGTYLLHTIPQFNPEVGRRVGNGARVCSGGRKDRRGCGHCSCCWMTVHPVRIISRFLWGACASHATPSCERKEKTRPAYKTEKLR